MTSLLTYKRSILLIGGIVFFLLTAIFSEGFYHGDEHFQIIEFAQFKLGNTAEINLPWEFGAQIRPSTQPIIAMGIFYFCDLISITDPYSKAFVLRLITSIFAFSAIVIFLRSINHLIKPSLQNWLLFLSLFLWFIPFINVRFSSETWAGITLLYGLSFLLREKRGQINYILAGLFIGFSFVFRFQMGFAVIGIVLWLILNQRKSVQVTFLFIVSSILPIGLSVAIDSWFYGGFVFTPWNYFEYNIIKGVASEFGTSPWYYYLFAIFRFSFFPIGILILLSLLKVTLTHPKNLIIWVVVPFILFHSVVGHKELRFLFPLANLVPFLIIMAIQEIKWSPFLTRVLLVGFIGINSTLLFSTSLIPAGNGETKAARRLKSIKKNQPVAYFKDSNPYNPWGLNMYFYEPIQNYYQLESVEELEKLKITNPQMLICVRNKYLYEEAVQSASQRLNLKVVHRSSPEWMKFLFKIYGSKSDEYFTIVR